MRLKIVSVIILIGIALVGCSQSASDTVTNDSQKENEMEENLEEDDEQPETEATKQSSLELKESFVAMDDVTFNFNGGEEKYVVGGTFFIVDILEQNNSEMHFNVSVAENGTWKAVQEEVIVSEELFAEEDGALTEDAEADYMFLEDAFYRISFEPEYVKEVENTSPVTKVLYDNKIKIHKITFNNDVTPIIEKIYEITVPQQHDKFHVDNWSNMTIVETNHDPIYAFATKIDLGQAGHDNGYTIHFFSKDGNLIYEMKDQENVKLFDIPWLRYVDLDNQLIFIDQNDSSKSNVYSYKDNEFVYEENGAPSTLEPGPIISIHDNEIGFELTEAFNSNGKGYEILTFERKSNGWEELGEKEAIELDTDTIYNHDEFFGMDDKNIYIFQEIKYKGEIAYDEYIISYN